MSRKRNFVVAVLGFVSLDAIVGGNAILRQSSIAPSNQPPEVAITYPQQGGLSARTYIRLKAAASDPDGTVNHVAFYEGTNLVGVATNPPYSVIWHIPEPVPGSPLVVESSLTAVAVDDLGAAAASDPFTIYINGHSQPVAVMEIISPKDGEIFAAPATFEFRVEKLVSLTRLEPPPPDSGFFLVGTNVMGASMENPYSVIVTNLPEGEYKLRALPGLNDFICDCPRDITIRVAKAGIRSASLTPEGNFKFSGFAGVGAREIVIQTSTNLLEWIPLRKNSEPATLFQFIDSELANRPARFYRLAVQP